MNASKKFVMPMPFDVKLYFSGSAKQETDRYLVDKEVYRLFTYAYPKEIHEYMKLAEVAGKRCCIMMDSGAFTAWAGGSPVQLPELVQYNKDILAQYGHKHEFIFISLDVIPGQKSRGHTSQEAQQAMEESYFNFLAMQQEFSNHYVLPVYHSGDNDITLRDAYMRLTDYICLSMDQNMAERDRLRWAQRTAVPGFKYHGLAATGNKMVTRIPWFSVDSSSWVTVAAMGSILWPANGAFRVLSVSTTSPSRHDAGAHITTLPDVEKASVLAELEKQGYDIDVLATDYAQRWRWNIDQWLNPPWQSNIEHPMDLFLSC